MRRFKKKPSFEIQLPAALEGLNLNESSDEEEDYPFLLELNDETLELILLYLDLLSARSVGFVCRRLRDVQMKHWILRAALIMIEIERFKLENASIIEKNLSYFNSDFSCFINPAVLLLDDILFQTDFITNLHADKLRKLHNTPESVANVFNALCKLAHIKPAVKRNPDGNLQFDYRPQMLFQKYYLVRITRALPQKILKTKDLSLVEKFLNKFDFEKYKKGNVEAFHIFLYIKALVLYNKLTLPQISIDYEYVNPATQYTSQWFLREMYRMLLQFSYIRRMAIPQVRLRSIVDQMKMLVKEGDQIRLKIGDSDAPANEYEKILDMNRTTVKIAKLDQLFLDGADNLSPIFLEEILGELIGHYGDIENPIIQNIEGLYNLEAIDLLSIPTEQNENHFEETERLNLNMLQGTLTSPLDTVAFYQEPDFTPYLSKIILTFLDIRTTYLGCALVSKGWNRAVKFHSGLRLHSLLCDSEASKEKFSFEISTIETKRRRIAARLKAERVTVDESKQQLNQLTLRDLRNLKTMHNPPAVYDDFLAPLVILLGGTPIRKKKTDGTITVSHWLTAKKLLMRQDIHKSINSLQLNTMSQDIISQIEIYLTKEHFTVEKGKKCNLSVGNLISWTFGVYNYHMAIRNYSLNRVEREMLDDKDVDLYANLDGEERRINMLYDYINEFCNDAEYQEFTINELSNT